MTLDRSFSLHVQPTRRAPGNGLDCLDGCFLASGIVLVASGFVRFLKQKTSLTCLKLNILYLAWPFASATTIPLYIYWMKLKRACFDAVTFSCANNVLYVMPCFFVFRWYKFDILPPHKYSVICIFSCHFQFILRKYKTAIRTRNA